MPCYEFENEEHGIRLVLPLSVYGRPDTIVLRRRTVPSRVTIGVGAKPPTDGEKLAAGYKQIEDRGQLQTGGNYLDVATIKRAIAEPDTA